MALSFVLNLNAAQVINARGISGTQIACGVEVAGMWETISSQLAQKQEAHRVTDEARALSHQR